MAPAQVTADYYAILEVDQTADDAAIRSSYRRLAKLQHPDKNPNDTEATARFQALLAAYSTLSNVSARRIYDIQYASIKSTRANPTTGKNKTGSSSQPNDKNAQNGSAFNESIRKLQQSLNDLKKSYALLQVQTNGVKSDLNQAEAVLRKLRDEEKKEKDEDTRRNTWLGYWFMARLSTEEKEARERRDVERRAAQRVRTAEVERLQARVTNLESRLSDLNKSIAEKQSEISLARIRETARQAAMKREEEERKRAKMWEEQRAREAERERKQAEEAARKLREWAERRAREAEREAAEAERLFKEWERRQAREAERERKQAEETDRRFREWVEAQVNEGAQASQRKNRKKKQESQACLHRGWWTRESGRAVCQECDSVMRRFAFRCPGCQMVACASCRDDLKRRAS